LEKDLKNSLKSQFTKINLPQITSVCLKDFIKLDTPDYSITADGFADIEGISDIFIAHIFHYL
jgi:hypothetical protein